MSAAPVFFARCVVVGAGLLGASLAGAGKAAGLFGRVVAVGRMHVDDGRTRAAILDPHPGEHLLAAFDRHAGHVEGKAVGGETAVQAHFAHPDFDRIFHAGSLACLPPPRPQGGRPKRLAILPSP